MPEAFIDSSVLIGLYFRHAGERASCQASLPEGAGQHTSRYALFEIARGFLRTLLTLHNSSLGYNRFSELHMASHSGQKMFRKYEMHTWLGAFDDFSSWLEQSGDAVTEHQRLELLRAYLRRVIRRGWNKLILGCQFHNDAGCIEQLAAPVLNENGLMTQDLPTRRCGDPLLCKVLLFFQGQRDTIDGLVQHLGSLPSQANRDTHTKHVPALKHLLAASEQSAEKFEGKMCHNVGDALICLESPHNHIIATKNERDFVPIATYLGKRCAISITSRSTASAVEFDAVNEQDSDQTALPPPPH